MGLTRRLACRLRRRVDSVGAFVGPTDSATLWSGRVFVSEETVDVRYLFSLGVRYSFRKDSMSVRCGWFWHNAYFWFANDSAGARVRAGMLAQRRIRRLLERYNYEIEYR